MPSDLVAGHEPVFCGGLPAGCPQCIALCREQIGELRPTCMVCLGRHFAYEPHVPPEE